MEYNKGLCGTCDFDTNCAFNRIFPVIFCEEFSMQETVHKHILESVNLADYYDDETSENCFCGE